MAFDPLLPAAFSSLSHMTEVSKTQITLRLCAYETWYTGVATSPSAAEVMENIPWLKSENESLVSQPETLANIL
jgi:hypothetical protein